MSEREHKKVLDSLLTHLEDLMTLAAAQKVVLVTQAQRAGEDWSPQIAAVQQHFQESHGKAFAELRERFARMPYESPSQTDLDRIVRQLIESVRQDPPMD